MTTNPIVFQILRDLGVPKEETLLQLKNNTLNLSCCRDDVTDDIVITIAENYKGLTTIYLSLCKSITDAAIVALAENCEGLTLIWLRCCNITDAAIITLAENCAGLKWIRLEGCIELTDAAIIALAERCVELTMIKLRWCENITDAAVIALAENCEYLENIDCNRTKVSATGRQLIQEVETRSKPPPLEEGWWMDDGTGPQCKGMIN